MWDVSLVEGSTEQWAELSVGLLLLPPPDHWDHLPGTKHVLFSDRNPFIYLL